MIGYFSRNWPAPANPNDRFGHQEGDREVTVSLGVATFPDDGQDSANLIAAA